MTVLVPKFTSALAGRLLVPLLAKRDIRMHLDAVGSFVWLGCDGCTTVADLAAAVAARFGIPPAAAERRVQLFLRQLVREGSIALTLKESD